MFLSYEILKRLWFLQIVQKKLISFKEEAHHQQSHIIKFRLFIYLFFAGRCPREKLTELLNEYYQITASVIKSQKSITWAGVKSKEGLASLSLLCAQTQDRPLPSHAVDPVTNSAVTKQNWP